MGSEICNNLLLGTSIDLTSTSGASESLTFDTDITLIVTDCKIKITTLVAADTTSPVVDILVGSTSVGTVTPVEADAAGKMVSAVPALLASTGEKGVIHVAAGTAIKFDVKTAAADSGSAAGAGLGYISYR